MKPVRFTEAAEADVRTAFAWYEQQREKLGVRFLDRVDEAVAKIARNPDAPQQVMPAKRRNGNREARWLYPTFAYKDLCAPVEFPRNIDKPLGESLAALQRDSN